MLSPLRTEVLEERIEPVDQYNQPVYPDAEAAGLVFRELEAREGIASIARINGAAMYLGAVAARQSKLAVVSMGDCSPDIDTSDAGIKASIAKISSQKIESEDVFGPHIFFTRELNQGIKRRTQKWVMSSEGVLIPNHFGRGVNGISENPQDRVPDPARLLTMAEHAELTIAQLGETQSGPFYTSHDLLSTDYEKCFVVEDDSGRKYSTTGAMLWLGYNSGNNASTPQSEFLSGVMNIAGVKLGPGNTASYLHQLTKLLRTKNPERTIVYMLRYGINPTEEAEMREMVKEISKIKNCIVLFDAHGLTKTTEDIDGKTCKTRKIQDFKTAIKQLGRAARDSRVVFAGANLETTSRDDYYECMNLSGEKPNGQTEVDPLLNPQQTQCVLTAINRNRTL